MSRKIKQSLDNFIWYRLQQEKKKKMSKDKKSNYYDVGGVEVLDVIKAKLTPEQYQGYLLGNSIKYQLRMFHKSDNPLRDAEKAANYSAWLRDELSSQAIQENL